MSIYARLPSNQSGWAQNFLTQHIQFDSDSTQNGQAAELALFPRKRGMSLDLCQPPATVRLGRLCWPVPFIINHELQYASMSSGQLIADGSFSLNQSLTGVIQLHQDFCSKMEMSHSDL